MGSRQLLSFGLALLLGASLDPTAFGSDAPPPGRPERIDLIELFPVARSDRPLASLDLGDGSAQRYLSSGWNPPRSGGAQEAFAWTRGRDAVIEVPIARPGALGLVLFLGPLPPGGALPTQELRVLWNGRPAGAFPVRAGKPRSVTIPIDAALQRIGPNRIDLLPRYWGVGEAPDGDRAGGVALRGVRLEGRRPQRAGAGVAAQLQDGAIVQVPDSVVTWWLVLPQEARLRGRIALRPAPGSRQVRAEVAVSLVDESGVDRSLARFGAVDLRDGSEHTLDVDLSDLAGRMVALTLSFVGSQAQSGEGGAESAPRARWSALWIEGRAPAQKRVSASTRRGPYNVLLVLFDALRADHTEPYGAASVRTPALVSLARRGVAFENVTANASWTRPSVVSALTALHPDRHRVTNMRAGLPQAVPYLPEILKRAGYATLGLIDNPQITRAAGFERGFDRLVDYRVLRPLASGPRSPEGHAEALWDRYLEPVMAGDERRFFVYLHGIDPHAPYEPPPPFDSLYGFGYQGNVTTSASSLDERMRLLHMLNLGESWLEEADVRQLRSQYAGEVTYMDRLLGHLLERLAERGLEERTLVVFLSDHGEEFLEHGFWGHGASVHETALRVPMILSLPGVLPAGRRPRFHAQLSDLAPTILDLLGIQAPPDMQGRSLLPVLDEPDAYEPDRPSFAKSMRKLRDKGRVGESMDAARFRDWKLIRKRRDGGGISTIHYSLFDLSDDPGERFDRWPTELVVGHTLRQMLEWHEWSQARTQAPAPWTVELDPQTREALRGLGYGD